MSTVNPWLMAQSSLKYFTVQVLQMRWPSHYQEWLEAIENNDRLLVQAPRGHGKSAFWALAYPLWRVIRGKRDILLVSYSEDQVRRLIREIRICVESNKFLDPLKPSTKELWGTDHLSFANGSVIAGLGFGTSSRGRHPDDIIVDDPLKDMGGMSDEDQERAYFGVITGMAMEKTKLACICTPVNFGDLLEKIERNEAYAKWKRPALNAKGEPLFPELWSSKALELKRKEQGSLHFAREYLLERVDPTTQPFKRQYETFYRELPTRFAHVVTVCDPAYTENDGDYTAIITVGFTHGNHAYVIEAKGIRKEDPGEIVKELMKTIRAHSPGVVGIERKKGTALEYSFREERTRFNLWDFKYVELSHGGKSKDDQSRIGGLVPRWENRSIHIHPEMKLLLDQIYSFRLGDTSKQHDDLVDALAYCFHPDMVQPNTGKQHVRIPQNTVSSNSFYRCGSAVAVQSKPLVNYGALLDRRVGEAA